MGKKIAIGMIHGIGMQKKDFADDAIKKLKHYFKKVGKQQGINVSNSDLIIEPIHWAPVVEGYETALWKQINGHELNWELLRKFIVSYVGDAIVYQAPSKNMASPNHEVLYNDIHDYIRSSLKKLAIRAGEDAPLCIISHSLGTIISSNFIYDLQSNNKFATIRSGMSPLEKGETLTLFYTSGSPLALWSMRYKNYGIPIDVPSKQLNNYYPNIKGEWINFYNKNDVLAYPLKTLNKQYDSAVTKDQPISCGNIFIQGTPFSHSYYLKDNKLIKTIAESLISIWRQINK